MFAAAHAGRTLRVGSGHGLFAADLELDLLRSASALEEAANRRREIRASTYVDCSGLQNVE